MHGLGAHLCARTSTSFQTFALEIDEIPLTSWQATEYKRIEAWQQQPREMITAAFKSQSQSTNP